jgi:hypothetical protein
METNQGTIYVGLIIIILCVFPFVLIYRHKAKKRKKMLQSLNERAQQFHCKVSQHEFCGDFVMGTDAEKTHIFFFKQKSEKSVLQSVDLSETRSCQISKKRTNVSETNESHVIIERLELVFMPINKNKEETRFELFDQEANYQLSGELQFADHWAKQINKLLKEKKQT